MTVRDTVKESGVIVIGGNQPVSLIDTDFSAGVDTVLSFPQFNEPGSVLMIKIDGFAVKDHLKMDGSPVVERAISEFPLPGIGSGGHHVLILQVRISEGFHEFIQQADFPAHVHMADFSDTAASSPVSAQEKQNTQKQKNSKEKIHIMKSRYGLLLSYAGINLFPLHRKTFRHYLIDVSSKRNDPAGVPDGGKTWTNW